MSLQPDQVRLEPKTFVLKHVRADLKTLLLSLGETAAQAKIGEAGNALSAFFKAMESVRIQRPPEELAWQLVCDGLARATTEMLRFDDDQTLPAVVYDGDLQHLKNRTQVLIEDADIVVTRQFFKNPAALPILPAVERTLAGWLRFLQPNQPNANTLNEAEARSLATRLYGYFPVALHEEWRRHRDRYNPLFEHFDTPFAEAAQIAWDWERNRLALMKQMDEPVFEETFSLRQVYVPLRAYHEERPAGRSRREAHDERESRRILRDLESAVTAWLEGKDGINDALCLVAGGPGSGKSTFAKHLAATRSATNQNVLFFELQDFAMEERIESAIGTYLHQRDAFAENPLEQVDFASTERPLLLVFDGLDELSEPSDYADRETANFISRLDRALNNWNTAGRRVLALITGRTPAVQTHAAGLNLADRQRLWVLPYVIDEEEREHLEGPETQLEHDQRQDWWERYALAKGLADADVPEALRSGELTELTAEPLLCYLVVLSGFHGDKQGSRNRNLIYKALYDSVIVRRHAGGARLAAAKVIEDETFDRLMETIAVAAWWHGEGRIASIEQIRDACGDDRALGKALDPFVETGHKPARLFAAFYFRAAEGRRQGGNAFEFTHKSFSEYLTARRLVREIERICKGRRDNADYYSEQQALTEWAKLTSPQAMSMDLLRFFRDEVALRPAENAVAWQDILTSLVNLELRTGFQLNTLMASEMRTAERFSNNSEESLLAALNSSALVTNTRSKISWGGLVESYDGAPYQLGRLVSHGAGEAIQRLRGQRFVVTRCLALEVLGLTEINHQNLMNQDLFRASFHKASLASSVLFRADLRGADLRLSNLSEAHLGEADLSDADLSCADLSDADLSGVNLRDADLSRTDLRQAYLIDAHLSHADLSRADLRQAYLTGVDLSGEKRDQRADQKRAGHQGRQAAEASEGLGGAVG